MPKLPFGRRRAPFWLDADSLAPNLSYVLHERSDSPAVAAVAAACLRHASRLNRRDLAALPTTVDGERSGEADVWLTPTLGVSERLDEALRSLRLKRAATLRVDAFSFVDGLEPPDRAAAQRRQASRYGAPSPYEGLPPEGIKPDLDDVTFFRAPARLALPNTRQRVGVAALLLRPGGATQLALRGAFAWPRESARALRELERLIQAYPDQWTPPRALWDAPAEILLGDEIG